MKFLRTLPAPVLPLWFSFAVLVVATALLQAAGADLGLLAGAVLGALIVTVEMATLHFFRRHLIQELQDNGAVSL